MKKKIIMIILYTYMRTEIWRWAGWYDSRGGIHIWFYEFHIFFFGYALHFFKV